MSSSATRTRAYAIRRKVYLSANWRKLSKAWLQAYPVCEFCGAPAEVVDHKRGVVVVISEGKSPFAEDELQSLCLSCSGKKDGERTPH